MNEQEINFLYRISKSYYDDGLTQQEIAVKHGVSRVMVSRLLQKALSEKIIEIIIHPPKESNYDLEKSLEEKYNLKEVVVVNAASDEHEQMLEDISRAGSEYFLRHLQGREIISISWGKTIFNLVNTLSSHSFSDMQIVQMIGGLGFPEEDISGTELVRRMANALKAKPKLLNSPGILKTEALCQELREEPQIKAALELSKKSHIAIVGIGQFSEKSVICQSNNILSKEDIAFLKKNSAVGDISLRFFNANGELIKGDIDKRVIGLEMDEIKAIPKVVGIAGGMEKITTIKAALKGKFINVLITDKQTAQLLMK